jgi:hypothetical protein
MQNVINTVKGTALGVAEYLTPVLKVIIYIYIQTWIRNRIVNEFSEFI